MALTGPGFGALGHQDVSVHAPRLQTHYCFATSVLHLFPMQLRTIATHVYFFFLYCRAVVFSFWSCKPDCSSLANKHCGWMWNLLLFHEFQFCVLDQCLSASNFSSQLDTHLKCFTEWTAVCFHFQAMIENCRIIEWPDYFLGLVPGAVNWNS